MFTIVVVVVVAAGSCGMAVAAGIGAVGYCVMQSSL